MDSIGSGLGNGRELLLLSLIVSSILRRIGATYELRLRVIRVRYCIHSLALSQCMTLPRGIIATIPQSTALLTTWLLHRVELLKLHFHTLTVCLRSTCCCRVLIEAVCALRVVGLAVSHTIWPFQSRIYLLSQGLKSNLLFGFMHLVLVMVARLAGDSSDSADELLSICQLLS